MCSHSNTCTPTRHTAFWCSCIPRIVHIVSLSPTGHTSRLRCVTAMSRSPPSEQACTEIPSRRRGTRVLQKYPTAAGFYTWSSAHSCAQVHPYLYFLKIPHNRLRGTNCGKPRHTLFTYSQCGNLSLQSPQTHPGTQPRL